MATDLVSRKELEVDEGFAEKCLSNQSIRMYLQTFVVEDE